ncbi:efflux RND transporter periplasmic adaptor subunit [Ottowia sp.]|uniref:efflux RND transporter periplasmic adaptor subunit n=1 Tax=Ottowia sp. TaxID=1898956 RepID=UPI002CF37312|nr:efflux RND transporter periplasmic adaptor subunit [Ottowia sp.]HRN75452.1 efflux RND transporter periplasmic adaptor subunit [Ottowia sp.]HRQ02591.1 efflux RND transporter periplasmic adaptor subunit [Ottowia sp.]
MKRPRLQGRTLALIAVIIPLALLFVYTVLRSGPLAPVAVTTTTVQTRALAPALSGIGTVQARFTYKIGPTFAGRLKRLDVSVGDSVAAGQLLGEMDPVDLDERLRAQQAGIKGAEAALRQAEAKQAYARTQAQRYQQLFAVQGSSEETLVTKQQELAVADAALAAAREDVGRLRAESQALRAQRSNLGLRTPVAGLVVLRHADPGTTVVAGQAVVEVIDPASLWIDTRFDQISAEGLTNGLPAQVLMRSRRGQALPAQVLRIEPLADAVTEEMLAKIVFDSTPTPLPPVGELAEVTVLLPALPDAPTIPNAAIRTFEGQRGVWKLADGELAFAPVKLGRADLDGNVQVTQGLAADDRVVVHSEKALSARSRIQVVERIAGVAP